MFKLGIGIILFGLCSYIGCIYGESFRKRYVQLKEILKETTILQNNVLYGMMPLPEAMENVAEKAQNPFKKFLNEISNELKDGNAESVYDGALGEYKKLESCFYLENDDKKVMEDFFKSLGESGVYGQEKIFSLTIEALKVNLKDAEESAKKNVKLYRYLGMCVGAMTFIFII